MSAAPRHRGGPDRWLVSYADLVTLLLAFFTTLYAASTVDATRLTPDAETGTANAAHQTTMEQLRTRLDTELAEAIEASRVEITRDIRGLVVSLPDDAAFPVASDTVAPGALDVVTRVASAVREMPNPLRIEGHTDDIPIRTAKYDSNWQLSTARAAAVVAYLVEQAGIDPARLSAAGYGEFHPRVPNDSTGNRARNRRIDIVVLERSLEASGIRPGGEQP